jgi:hypothetical protein
MMSRAGAIGQTAHTLKAADIPDEVVMDAIRNQLARQGYSSRGDVRHDLRQYPGPVVNAKMRSMVKRGLIDTCDSPNCSCSSLVFLSC